MTTRERLRKVLDDTKNLRTDCWMNELWKAAKAVLDDGEITSASYSCSHAWEQCGFSAGDGTVATAKFRCSMCGGEKIGESGVVYYKHANTSSKP